MFKADKDQVAKNYDAAKKVYAAYGVNTDAVLEAYRQVPISLHCWQGDDVTGFEKMGDVTSQNLVTGNYPGRARTADELRGDIDTVFSLAPGGYKVNLHSMYAEPGTTDRNKVTAEDFRNWITWAKKNGFGLDFNASFFTHPEMNNGFSLASLNKKTRDYWIEAGKGARAISNDMGKELNQICVNNIWIPDGLKDLPANRFKYRSYLEDALDEILEKPYSKEYTRDVLEGKLFAIGVETFTVGSHEFYLGYAAKKGIGVCMDTGHYHPTESIVDKISSVYRFVDTLLLHISRGIRWDSDHVLIQGDDLTGIMQEVKRGGLYKGNKLFMGLDYFDASINRVAAWVIGMRAAGKSLLTALLEPSELLFKAEEDGDFTLRLALTDEFKNLPANAVWDYACLTQNKPVGTEWIDALKAYETNVMLKRK